MRHQTLLKTVDMVLLIMSCFLITCCAKTTTPSQTTMKVEGNTTQPSPEPQPVPSVSVVEAVIEREAIVDIEPHTGFVEGNYINRWNNDKGKGCGVIIQNESKDGTTICGVFFRPPADSAWGQNRLKNSLDPGGSKGIALEPGTWHLKLTDCDENILYESDAVVELNKSHVKAFFYY